MCILVIETEPESYPAISNGGWVFYEFDIATYNTFTNLPNGMDLLIR